MTICVMLAKCALKSRIDKTKVISYVKILSLCYVLIESALALLIVEWGKWIKREQHGLPYSAFAIDCIFFLSTFHLNCEYKMMV